MNQILTILVAANLPPAETMCGLRVLVPEADLQAIGQSTGALRLRDLLATDWTVTANAADLPKSGLPLPDLPPCSAVFVEIRKAE